MNVSLSAKITGFPEGSPWEHLNTQAAESIMFTWADFLRAAMVAGYPDLTKIPSPQFADWRTAGLHLALRHVNGELVRPPEFGRLDPSEKAAVSSLLGVIVTKLLVERLLQAPTFLFLDVYFTLEHPDGHDAIRPDFAAMTPGQGWFSVEAKGRSSYRGATLNAGKQQAKALGTVNDQPVLAVVVCVTSFRGGKMHAHFADPPRKPPGRSSALRIDPMRALEKYYSQVTRFESASEAPSAADLAAVPGVYLRRSPVLDVTFGVLPALTSALEARSLERVTRVLKGMAERQSGLGRDLYLGPDGVIVIPGRSWAKDG